MDRTIVLKIRQQAEAACTHIVSNWEAMAREERPMACRMYEHKEKRSLEQQAIMWLRLGDIAEQVWIAGKKFSADTWAIHSKQDYLPEDDGPSKEARKGYRKWDCLPTGERVLIGSTTQLTVFGMAEYITKIEAFGARMGVKFSASPAESAGYR